MTAATVADALRSLPPERGQRVEFQTLDAICTIAVDALRGEVAPVIAAASHTSQAWQSSVGSTFEPALRWLASQVTDRDALVLALRHDADESSQIVNCVTRSLG